MPSAQATSKRLAAEKKAVEQKAAAEAAAKKAAEKEEAERVAAAEAARIAEEAARIAEAQARIREEARMVKLGKLADAATSLSSTTEVVLAHGLLRPNLRGGATFSEKSVARAGISLRGGDTDQPSGMATLDLASWSTQDMAEGLVAEFFTASILPGSTPRVAAVMIAHDLGNVAQLKAYARIEAALLGAKFCCEHTCIFGESGGDDMTTKCASFFALGLKKGAQAYDKKRLQSCGLDLRELLRDDAG